MAKALQDFHLPPEVALGPNPAFYRAGQNQLLASLFVGEAQAKGSAPDDFFKVTKVVNGVKSIESAYGYGGYYAYGTAPNTSSSDPD